MTSVLRGDKACAWYFAKKKKRLANEQVSFSKEMYIGKVSIAEGKTTNEK